MAHGPNRRSRPCGRPVCHVAHRPGTNRNNMARPPSVINSVSFCRSAWLARNADCPTEGISSGLGLNDCGKQLGPAPCGLTEDPSGDESRASLAKTQLSGRR